MKIPQIFFPILLFMLSEVDGVAQPDRWKQAVDYTMEVNLDVSNHSYAGTQHLVYTNNSPDTLNRVFYHLYFNAFQPGSMMDIRSLTIADPDRRVMDRISQLSETEIGKLYPSKLKMNGMSVEFKVIGTVMETSILPEPILPHSSVVFDMDFDGQVPIQIRRSGRDNKEGIAYSMSQWYPEMCQYDQEGWHTDPYIAREFYGIWGNYTVAITIDPQYVVAASGILQNGNEIGYGYEDPGVKVKKHKTPITYHFKAERVHDFMWAADPDYVHKKVQVPGGPVMHYFYQPDEITSQTWPRLMEISPKMVEYMSKRFGTYPYPVFNVIQGGDGGMEYPMSTLILGKGSYKGLVGVTVHEMFHSWYQGVLGSNESLYPWMDEGFTSYASSLTMQYLFQSKGSPTKSFYDNYFQLVKSGKQEPMSTHSDHYNTNVAYSVAAYSMGAMVLSQLSYIIGEPTFSHALKNYFNTWKFNQPNPNDFKRIMEKESRLELGWFFNDWIMTTKHTDYAFISVENSNKGIIIILKNKDQRPMPVELLITKKTGEQSRIYLPLRMMRGVKQFNDSIPTRVKDAWPWTNPYRQISFEGKVEDIQSIVIDPEQKTADIDTSNNVWRNKN